MKPNVLLVALATAVLASCGASGSATDQTTLGLTSTNYVTVSVTPTTTTTTTIAGQGIAGTVHPEAGSYVVAAGDFPANIARRYKVVFNDFMAANGWTLVGNQVPGFPAPGATIIIPPGWTEPGTATETTLAASGDTTPPTETTTTIAGGQSNCAPGEYTIVAGDFLGKVAKKLDTTVDALNAANASTKGYKSFFVGLKIKTPPKANC